MPKRKPCPYFYVSLTANQHGDNNCILEEGHKGDHVKREILPPPQQFQQTQQGWIKANPRN